nr:hypothetical protein [Desulfobacterales bacterium]
MGEIRSTLDIIMEKTKHLTMSEEEKEELRKKELRGKVKGIVQKFLDGQKDIRDIKSVIETEGKHGDIQEFLKIELIERINPNDNNENIFQLLEEVLNINTIPLKRVINEFQKKVAEEKAIRLKNLKNQLANRGISGSAVVPNMALDEEWNQFLQKSVKECKDRLSIIAES